MSLDCDAVEFFQQFLDTFNQHPFEIRLVHSLQGNFSASYDKNMFIVHNFAHLSFSYLSILFI